MPKTSNFVLLPSEFSQQQANEGRLLRAGCTAMACQFEIFFSTSERQKISYAHQALVEVKRLEKQLTVFCENSEVSRLNREAQDVPVTVEENLFRLLAWAILLSHKTDGALDITAGQLSRCWGFQERQGRVPLQTEIDQALYSVGFRWVCLNAQRHSVFFRRRGLELNLGCLGKGYALDRAADLLRNSGLKSALLHAGYSTIFAMGCQPGKLKGKSWLVSVRHPLKKSSDIALIRLCDQALSTSGPAEQFFTHKKKSFGHIIDPRSGHPANCNISVTVIADTAVEADALSTAFFVMKPKEIASYCEKTPGVGALVIQRPTTGMHFVPLVFGLATHIVEVVRDS